MTGASLLGTPSIALGIDAPGGRPVLALGATGSAESANQFFALENTSDNSEADGLNIVTTTALLADIVSNVALENAEVSSLIPAWADPHSYEVKLHDMRKLAYGDIVFSNNLLLEEQSVMRAVEANRKDGAPHVQLAEESKKYGANLIQLVEDAALDTIWLGMRVRDPLSEYDSATDEVRICATAVDGPGNVSAFLTGTFGQPQVYIDSSDGLSETGDCVPLPTNAHTHMSWAFTQPGYYTLDLQSYLAADSNDDQAQALSTTQVRFAVGVDPYSFPTSDSFSGAAQILRSGHMDISVNLQGGNFELYGDRLDGEAGDAVYEPEESVIEVPNAALSTVPSEVQYRFLGRAGDEIYLLAQAVLGKHVHGEIDPHVWESVSNVIAITQVIRDSLTQVDPAHGQEYSNRADQYIAQLNELESYVKETIGRIPEERRNLVTTHDAYGYLGDAYGLNVAGFVTANASQEPSAQDLIRLARTLQELQVPAVFVEPTYAAQANTLITQAREAGIEVCQIYGDSLRDPVNTYVELMATNAFNLKTCLDPENAVPQRFQGTDTTIRKATVNE